MSKKTFDIKLKRVVVTGLGAITPLGLTAEESWQTALKGQSGIAPITRFSTEGFDVTFAGEVKGFQADLYVAKKEQKKMEQDMIKRLEKDKIEMAASRKADQ